MKLTIESQKVYEYGTRTELVEGSLNFVNIELDCSKEWDGYLITVQFIQKGKTINKYIGNERKLMLPPDVSPGWLMISCFGVKEGLPDMATVTGYETNVLPKSFSSTPEAPIPPTPNLYAQLIGDIQQYANEVEENADVVREAKRVSDEIKENAEQGVYDGEDYVLTETDKQEIADKIKISAIEELTLDTIDTFYEEQVKAPYITEEEPLLPNFSYSGPYEINSHEDLSKMCKHIEKNTDLIRYEIDEINVTVDGVKKSLISRKEIFYSADFTDSNGYSLGKGKSGEALYALLEELRNNPEASEYNFMSSNIMEINGVSLMYLHHKFTDDVYGFVTYIPADGITLYKSNENNALENLIYGFESLGAKTVIFSDCEINGRVYIEHYGDTIKTLYDNGHSMTYPSTSECPAVSLNLVNSPDDAFDPSGYIRDSDLFIAERFSVNFVNNFIPNDFSQERRLCKLASINDLRQDAHGLTLDVKILGNKLLGSISAEKTIKNPNFRSFIGWEKVYENTFEHFDYYVDNKEYGKYDYMIAVYQNEDGYMPDSSMSSTLCGETGSTKQTFYFNSIPRATHCWIFFNYNGARLDIKQEYFNPDDNCGMGAYVSGGVMLGTPKYLSFVESIKGSLSTTKKGCKVELYRKRCC